MSARRTRALGTACATLVAGAGLALVPAASATAATATLGGGTVTVVAAAGETNHAAVETMEDVPGEFWLVVSDTAPLTAPEGPCEAL